MMCVCSFFFFLEWINHIVNHFSKKSRSKQVPTMPWHCWQGTYETLDGIFNFLWTYEDYINNKTNLLSKLKKKILDRLDPPSTLFLCLVFN